VVLGSGSAYTVTVNGIHGSGTLQLELVDNDTITGNGVPLGGAGIGNGSFIGQSYTILQTYPTVLSINRWNPAGPNTSATSVSYTVTFSEPVTGVDAGDFALALNGVTASTPVVVSGSSASYTVTVNGVSGTGTLGLNLVDNGSIHDLAGNPLIGASLSYQSGQSFATTGAFPNSVVTADVNGDGNPDLLIASSKGINLLLGNGNGTFQPQTIAGSGYGRLAVADLNGDGIPDFAFADDNVGLLLGNGNGTFKKQQINVIGYSNVAVGDVNGDGKPDIVAAAGFNNGVVGVLLSNGNGTFTSSQSVSSGGAQPRSINITDLNGDGKPDLVLVNYGIANYRSASVGVLLGNGNGMFQNARMISTGPPPPASVPTAVVAADVNGDGIPDLIVSNVLPANSEVEVMLGNGNGTFRPAQTFAVDREPSALAVADVNGDGKPDVIVTNEGSYDVGVLLGNGNGTFAQQQTFNSGFKPIALCVADLNGDGRLDLVATNDLSGTTNLSSVGHVLLNSGNGNFTGQTYAILPVVDTINGTSGNDTITLVRNIDGNDIDWTMGTSGGQFPANDPNCLTINGNGGNDTIALDYTNGNPLPVTLHLNGEFTINNLQGSNPLAGITLEIGRSTVFISYGGSDPIATIQWYLKAGYNGGAWNGIPTTLAGVITSAAAQANPNHTTAIGYADAADGQGINTVANTIELKYTLIGDANLDGLDNTVDLQPLLFAFNTPGAWDQGDFNYDGTVNTVDLQGLLFNFNTSVGGQARPAAVASAALAGGPVTAPASGTTASAALVAPALAPVASAAPPSALPAARGGIHSSRRGRRHRQAGGPANPRVELQYRDAHQVRHTER
jgi:hypothetical protein